MTDHDLNELIKKRDMYRLNGKVMDYREFVLMVDELIERHKECNIEDFEIQIDINAN